MSDAESPRRRRRPAPPPPPPAGSAAKGAALVVLAVVIGFVLLRDDSSQSITTGSGSGSGSSVTSEPEDSSSSTTSSTTTQPLHDRQFVKVLVANGTSVSGAAGGATAELKAKNYVTGTPVNATAVAATEIHYAAGYEGEAKRLATDLALLETAVRPLTTPAPVEDMQGSNILVVIGPDKASQS